MQCSTFQIPKLHKTKESGALQKINTNKIHTYFNRCRKAFHFCGSIFLQRSVLDLLDHKNVCCHTCIVHLGRSPILMKIESNEYSASLLAGGFRVYAWTNFREAVEFWYWFWTTGQVFIQIWNASQKIKKSWVLKKPKLLQTKVKRCPNAKIFPFNSHPKSYCGVR